MTIETWVKDNVKPLVKEVGKIVQVNEENGVKLFDVGVFAFTDKEKKVLNRFTQSVYQIGENFFFGRTIVKNFEEPEKTSEKELAFKFLAIENTIGQEVKVDPEHLDKLGIKYFVYKDPVDGLKKITTELDGVLITREVA